MAKRTFRGQCVSFPKQEKVCGTLLGKGKRTCLELRSNAQQILPGLYVCPRCHSELAPDFYIDQKDRVKYQETKDEEEEEEEEVEEEPVANNKNYEDQIQTVTKTIKTCTNLLRLPEVVTRRACELAAELISSNPQKIKLHNNVDLVIALVDLCALQNETPRITSEFIQIMSIANPSRYQDCKQRLGLLAPLVVDSFVACYGLVCRFVELMIPRKCPASAQELGQLMNLAKYTCQELCLVMDKQTQQKKKRREEHMAAAILFTATSFFSPCYRDWFSLAEFVHRFNLILADLLAYCLLLKSPL